MSTEKTKKAPVVKAPEVDNEWTVIASSEGKSIYGHRLNTLASMMDAMIDAGKFTKVQIEKAIVDQLKKTPGRAKQALKAHIRYLPGSKGVTVKINNGSVDPKKLDFVQGFIQPKTK